VVAASKHRNLLAVVDQQTHAQVENNVYEMNLLAPAFVFVNVDIQEIQPQENVEMLMNVLKLEINQLVELILFARIYQALMNANVLLVLMEIHIHYVKVRAINLLPVFIFIFISFNKL
jgi:hypothetical protein